MSFTSRSIDSEKSQSFGRKQRKLEGEIDWQAYYSYQEIYAWLDTLQAKFPEFITVEEFGRTYEGRPLKIVKLSKQQVIEITFNLLTHYQL